MSSEVVLGIDTSNYTTSAAALDHSNTIISDRRKLLEVKKGERGLRQQEALFQHVNNLPVLIKELMDDISGRKIKAVSVSTRPRPVEGSYMPVFNAGYSAASIISEMLGIPLFTYSHQEGHVAAALLGRDTGDRTICFHLSGGTMEAVMIPGYEIVYRTRDISYGQLIDRAGVAMGLDFPAGKELDHAAMDAAHYDISLPEITVTDEGLNLSGIETSMLRLVEKGTADKGELAAALFDRIADSIGSIVGRLDKKYSPDQYVFAGGVSSSRYIKEKLLMTDLAAKFLFASEELASDNAVGTAALGGKEIWH